jgi:thymidylate synthase (FAD)
MIVIEPYFKFIAEPDSDAMLKRLEQIGRVCYKSEDKIAEDSAIGFIYSIMKNGHESVIEHESV